MNLWMRWVNFQALREILLLVEANSAKLRAADLVRLTTEERILIGRNGQTLGPSSHYHHRRTLERLGLVVKRDGRYALNEQLAETRALTAQTAFGKKLDDCEKEAFSNVVLRNEDCRNVFFQKFIKHETLIEDVKEFTARAQPIEMSVGQRQVSPHHSSREVTLHNSGVREQEKQVAIRPVGTQEWSVLSGINAIQAIHFGLRAWCVDQLSFLDGIYRTGAVYTIYPRQIMQLLPTRELAFRMVDSLSFENEWTTVRVGDFALKMGIEHQVAIEQTKSVLQTWTKNYPDVVAGIPTNERFITGGLANGQRRIVLKGFLLERGGAYVSHLRIHQSLQHRVKREVRSHD